MEVWITGVGLYPDNVGPDKRGWTVCCQKMDEHFLSFMLLADDFISRIKVVMLVYHARYYNQLVLLCIKETKQLL